LLLLLCFGFFSQQTLCAERVDARGKARLPHLLAVNASELFFARTACGPFLDRKVFKHFVLFVVGKLLFVDVFVLDGWKAMQTRRCREHGGNVSRCSVELKRGDCNAVIL